MRAALAAGLAALAATAIPSSSPHLPGAPRCPLFPADNAWNRRVDALPVATNSDVLIRSIGLDSHAHADFGSGLWDSGKIGIPYVVVPGSTPRTRVSFEYADESDPGPYPIPRNVPIEAGSDHHALIVDRDACRLYELGGLERSGGRWHAWAGATWSLRSNKLRPATWTSADAAGLPILPGLARYDEVARGSANHAMRFTAVRTRRAYVWPARHYASSLTDPDLPPMGLRVRLKRGFDTSGFPRQARILLEAWKRYGLILADNGSSWYVTGAPDARWSNDQLHTLHQVHGSDFEVVDPAAIHP
jgi:hypothetical protein